VVELTRRARRGRIGSGARSLARAEAELPADVRRRLRARSPAAAGWVPDAPEQPADETPDEDVDGAAVVREGSVEDPAFQDDALPSTAARMRAALGDRVPVGLRGAEVVPSRRAVAGLAGLLAAALALALALVWVQRPHESAAPLARRVVPNGAVLSLSPTATPRPRVVVHVTGAVRRPGLVELPGGSRVNDAVSAAGGATRRADLASVNLARVLVDGEQIVVLRRGAVAAPVVAPGTSTGGASAPTAPVDLNIATLQQLDGLPGVGPVLAQRIIDWRSKHGRFSSVDELTEVSGIGERTLADLRALVRV
jgi:competence protein ComEA